jgi:hypothetical protein
MPRVRSATGGWKSCFPADICNSSTMEYLYVSGWLLDLRDIGIAAILVFLNGFFVGNRSRSTELMLVDFAN